jgi:hypothetical protein
VTLRELVERRGLASRLDHSEIRVGDFEYNHHGPQPDDASKPIWPLGLVVHELHTGQYRRYWRDDLHRMTEAPFDIGPRSLFVSFAAWAELQCFKQLGWTAPANVLDLHAEHRVETNGLVRPKRQQKNDLITAAQIRGLDTMESAAKTEMRNLILSKHVFSRKEIELILHYCKQDVELTTLLFRRMLRNLDLKRALWRGRYSVPVGGIQCIGVPTDVPLLGRIAPNWLDIKRVLIREMDSYHLFQDTSFNLKLFDQRVVQPNRLDWPRYPDGNLIVKDDTFEDMARVYPVVRPIRELRRITGKMRQFSLTVDEDTGLNRYLISPFQTVTGRNAPSNSHSVFGLGAWLRHLITPRTGTVMLYCDWSSQEYVIAAVLSGDELMWEDCQHDPYIRFGQRLGRLPEWATKKTHETLRERFKISALATLYGQTEISLGPALGISVAEARYILEEHIKLYARFHQWQSDFVSGARAAGLAWTQLGWAMRVTHQTKRRTLMNWPMQSYGAEMLRIALVMLDAAGIRVCAPVHDAVLVEAPEAEAVAAKVRAIMTRASEKLLGVATRVSITPIRFGERLVEKRGVEMWNRVMGALHEVEKGALECV